MIKGFIQNRDELLVLHIDNIAYLLADGNYTKIVYIGGIQVVITMGISKVEEIIRQQIGSDAPSKFVRLGRSLVINQKFLHHINVYKTKVDSLRWQQEHPHPATAQTASSYV